MALYCDEPAKRDHLYRTLRQQYDKLHDAQESMKRLNDQAEASRGCFHELKEKLGGQSQYQGVISQLEDSLQNQQAAANAGVELLHSELASLQLQLESEMEKEQGRRGKDGK